MSFETFDVFCGKHSKSKKSRIEQNVFRMLDKKIDEMDLDMISMFSTKECMSSKAYKELYDFNLENTEKPCQICFESIKSQDYIFMPCCFAQYITITGNITTLNNAYLHRKCIQKSAYSSGYKFKCPLCQNVDYIVPYLKSIGIYIPMRHPLWENSVYQNHSLLGVNVFCGIENCLKKDDRYFHNDNEFNIVVCCTCGSNGAHKVCLEITHLTVDTFKYLCKDCKVNQTNINKSIAENNPPEDDISSCSSTDDIDTISVHSSGSEKREWSADELFAELDKNYPVMPKPVQEIIQRPQRSLLGYPIFYI